MELHPAHFLYVTFFWLLIEFLYIQYLMVIIVVIHCINKEYVRCTFLVTTKLAENELVIPARVGRLCLAHSSNLAPNVFVNWMFYCRYLLILSYSCSLSVSYYGAFQQCSSGSAISQCVCIPSGGGGFTHSCCWSGSSHHSGQYYKVV